MLQMLRSLCRQLVNPHATIRGRNVPLGFHQLFLEKPLESRIERAFFDLKQIVGRALNMLCEGHSRANACCFNVRKIIISNAPGKRSRCSRFFMDGKRSPGFKSANVTLGLEQNGIKTLDGSQETKKVETRRAGPEQQLLFRRLKFALPAHPPTSNPLLRSFPHKFWGLLLLTTSRRSVFSSW